MMDNIPGNPGGTYSVLPAKRCANKNQIRIRPRAWFELEGGPYRLYSRIADEFREYPVRNGIKRDKRAYTFPDEIFLDNLYLEGRQLEADWLETAGISSFDFRIGRMNLHWCFPDSKGRHFRLHRQTAPAFPAAMGNEPRKRYAAC